MTLGLIGRKCGMTRVFKDDGTSVPVTVLDVMGNRVVQFRKEDVDGYRAVQVTYGEKAAKHVTKPMAGHFSKASLAPGVGLWEFRLSGDESANITPGTEIGADLFAEGDRIDVTGTSKGKGFAGVIKRWSFSMQDATHGNSLSHRAAGSTGQNQSPGRVFKGKKMAGHMGAEKCTQQNLEVVRVDRERNLLLVRGAVPGASGGHVIIRSRGMKVSQISVKGL